MGLSPPDPVVLTRSPEDNARLAAALRAAGQVVLELPCTATRALPPPDLAEGAAALVFTSRRGVLAAQRWPTRVTAALARRPAPIIAAVGPATAAALRAAGWPPALVADPPEGRVLAERLLERLRPPATVLVLRGREAAPGLDERLVAAGLQVESLAVYENVAPPLPPLEPRRAGAVFFASPSAARRLLGTYPWLAASPCCSIGPTTSAALRALGVAAPQELGPDPDTWCEALLQTARAHGGDAADLRPAAALPSSEEVAYDAPTKPEVAPDA